MNSLILKIILYLISQLLPGGIPIPAFILQIIATILMVITVAMIAITAIGLLGMAMAILWFGRHSIASDEYPRHPWASAWTRPRATIRAICNTAPTRWTMVLGTLYGAVVGLQALTIWQPFFDIAYGWTLGFGVLGFSLLGMAMVYGAGYLIPFIAGMFGWIVGEKEAQAAYAWSRLPALACIVTWLPQLLVRRIFAFLPVKFFGGIPAELGMFFTGVNIFFLALSALYLFIMIGSVGRKGEMRVEWDE